jgi:AraC family transcriptional regulator, regulatory protein of adaptative response / methylated-DNA-[protein]-cysteine methyltransferase
MISPDMRHARAELITYAIAPSAIGLVLAAESAKGICSILLGDAAKDLVAELRGRFPEARLQHAPPRVRKSAQAIAALIDTPGQNFSGTLDARGTAFQKTVWRALQRIPLGQTMTYAMLAQRIQAPKAVRAVASACAANPLAVVVPCHRVVRSTGALAGYRWGLKRKQALLAREGANVGTAS